MAKYHNITALSFIWKIKDKVKGLHSYSFKIDENHVLVTTPFDGNMSIQKVKIEDARNEFIYMNDKPEDDAVHDLICEQLHIHHKYIVKFPDQEPRQREHRKRMDIIK